METEISHRKEAGTIGALTHPATFEFDKKVYITIPKHKIGGCLNVGPANDSGTIIFAYCLDDEYLTGFNAGAEVRELVQTQLAKFSVKQ